KEDPFGDAYEVFVGDSIRGQEGQFFTPQNVVSLLVSLIKPRQGETIIDPACGSGSFLNASARWLISNGVQSDIIAKTVFGTDKDRYLSELASARLSLITLAQAKVYCADSLAWKPDDEKEFEINDSIGKFDIVLTNPPFGSKIIATSDKTQKTFELGYKWDFDSSSKRYVKTNELLRSVPPQVLFVERCIGLLKPGGRLGMVIPESLMSSKGYKYVVQHILDNTIIRAVIGMPEALFKTSGKGGTHTKTVLLVLQKDGKSEQKRPHLFMAEAKWCGKNSRGQRIDKDDLPEILIKYDQFSSNNLGSFDHNGYAVEYRNIVDNVLAPRYYNPEVDSTLDDIKSSHKLITIGELIKAGVLEIKRGNEIGGMNYGSGNIPFVRTSDISNWEVKIDPKQGVSEEIYNQYKLKQDIQEDDLLMVKDGTYLIGTCAIITKYDTKIVYQSHLYKIRILNINKLSPFLLLAILSSDPVQQQIKSKRFTQDIIDSLGNRINEIVLPIPKDKKLQKQIDKLVKKTIKERVEARELARKATEAVINGL
ncbi:MAG: N-6 DNA methylase, partial [bacterium]